MLLIKTEAAPSASQCLLAAWLWEWALLSPPTRTALLGLGKAPEPTPAHGHTASKKPGTR